MDNKLKRCEWCGDDPLYIKYHDEEWGIPVHDERKLFEMLILEGAQAGLSWITILRKRENYLKAFDNFEPEAVAKYDEKKFNELMSNPGIVRNRLKIRAAIKSAKLFLEIQKEYGSFDKYIWQFVYYQQILNNWKSIKDIPATSEESDNMSKALKKRGFSFVGSTICYSFMQAVGMVGDHIVDCHRYKKN